MTTHAETSNSLTHSHTHTQYIHAHNAIHAGNQFPTLGEFFVTTRAEGDIRNWPRVGAPTVTSGNRTHPIVRLTGDFGPSAIYIKQFLASAAESMTDT